MKTVSIFVALLLSGSSLTAAAQALPLVGSSAEWLAPKEVMVHTPGEELFVGVVHPAAGLFERPFSLKGAAKEHAGFIRLLEERGAHVHNLVDVLMEGTVDAAGKPIAAQPLADLQAFAASFLQYDATDLPIDMQATQETYRGQMIKSLHPEELVKIILQQPSVILRATPGLNTGYTANYAVKPVMNMYFMRDQAITTKKGLVIGHFNSEQRHVESSIAKFAYKKIGVQPIFEVSQAARLEGGDFIPAGQVAFLGQGLRTNAKAVAELLEAQVFGTDLVVIVKEPWKNQDQMHLDTYFNILGPQLAVLVEQRMNVYDGSGRLVKAVNPERRLTVDVYQLSQGGYVKILADGDFQTYVEKSLGYKLLPVSESDQLKYGINFLSVGPSEILAIDGVSEEYKAILKANGVKATWMDFQNLTGGYGAAHCTTQVFRRN